MGKFSPVAVAPRYMAAFRCVGDACPDNCCTGWKVSIDKPTYQRYRSVKIEPLASLLHANVQRGNDPNRAYAEMRMRSDTSCPMLDEHKLCQIQSQLGAEALSRTCTDYPRQYTRDGAQLHLRATLSCPEAARLALADAQAMDPIEHPLDFANDNLVPIHARREAPPADADVVRQHGALLGDVVASVVRADGLSAVQSLVVVGLMLRRVARQGVELDPATLAEAVEQFCSPESIQRAPDLVAGLPVSKPMQLDLLLSTTQRYVATQPVLPAFRRLMDEVWQGLHGPQGWDVAASRLADIDRTQFQAFEQAHPHVLKNYLLNELGYALFPRKGVAEMEREFMAIAVKFALVKLYACGLMGLRGEAFGSDDMVRVVYVVARSITHNRCFMPDLLETLAQHDALSLDVLATLIL